MHAKLQATRAIGAIFIKQKLQPIAIIVGSILIAILALIIILALTLSKWWLIFLIPYVPLAFIAVLAIVVAYFVVRQITPTLTKDQKQAAKAYVENLNDVTERLQTPQFLIAVKIILDVLRRRWQGGFIHQTTQNSTRLKKDFDLLVTSFSESS